MKKFLYVIISSLLIIGCFKKEEMQDVKKVDLDNEKHAVIELINTFNSSYAKKDWDGLKKCLATTVHCFGTDTAEVMNSVSDFEKQTKNDWQLYDAIKLGTPRNLFIEIDKDGELANAIYELYFNVIHQGKGTQNISRFSVTFKKENGEWKIVHSLVQMATMGQSSAGQIKKK